MHLLARNKRTISYKSYLGTTTESVDSDGYYTGEKAPSYSEMKTVMAYMTANRGEAGDEMFGKALDYDNILYVGLDCDIDEYSPLWVFAESTADNDYEVRRVSQSLNHKAIAIKKVR